MKKKARPVVRVKTLARETVVVRTHTLREQEHDYDTEKMGEEGRLNYAGASTFAHITLRNRSRERQKECAGKKNGNFLLNERESDF